MLRAHQEFSAKMTGKYKLVIWRQIGATDKQIDALVYELYGLTQEEITIVEGTHEASPGTKATDRLKS
jgi:hypothetical protein